MVPTVFPAPKTKIYVPDTFVTNDVQEIPAQMVKGIKVLMRASHMQNLIDKKGSNKHFSRDSFAKRSIFVNNLF